jgi:hypothetical protein
MEELLEELSEAVKGLTSSQKDIVALLNDTFKFQKQNSEKTNEKINSDSKLNKDFYSWIRSELPANQKIMFDKMQADAQRMEKYLSINEQILKKAQKNDDTMLEFVKVMQSKKYETGANQMASDYGDQRRKFQDKNFGRTMFDFASEQIPLLGLLTKNYTDAPGSAKNRRAEQAKVMGEVAENKYQNYKEDSFNTHVLGEEGANKHKKGKETLSNYEDTMLKYGSNLFGNRKNNKESEVGPVKNNVYNQPMRDQVKQITSGKVSPVFDAKKAIESLDRGIIGNKNEESSNSDEAIKNAKKTPSDRISRSELTKLPAAYSAGYLYLGDVIKESMRLEDKKQKIDVHESGGGGGVFGMLKNMLPGLLGMIVTALPAILAVGAGAALMAFIVNDTTKRNKERDAILKGLTPAQQAELDKKGIDTSKITMLEDAKAAKGIATGSKGSDIALNLNDSSITANTSILKAKQEAVADAYTNAKNILGDYTAGGYSFQVGSNGGFVITSPDGKKSAQIPSLGDGVKQAIMRNSKFKDRDMDMLESRFDNHIWENKGKPVKFAQGGFVPGNKGDEVQATLHGGEQVRNQGEVSNDFKELKDLMRQQLEINTQLLEELKKNTQITDKKELKVETPQPFPQANRSFVKG